MEFIIGALCAARLKVHDSSHPENLQKTLSACIRSGMYANMRHASCMHAAGGVLRIHFPGRYES